MIQRDDPIICSIVSLRLHWSSSIEWESESVRVAIKADQNKLRPGDHPNLYGSQYIFGSNTTQIRMKSLNIQRMIFLGSFMENHSEMLTRTQAGSPSSKHISDWRDWPLLLQFPVLKVPALPQLRQRSKESIKLRDSSEMGEHQTQFLWEIIAVDTVVNNQARHVFYGVGKSFKNFRKSRSKCFFSIKPELLHVGDEPGILPHRIHILDKFLLPLFFWVTTIFPKGDPALSWRLKRSASASPSFQESFKSVLALESI